MFSSSWSTYYRDPVEWFLSELVTQGWGSGDHCSRGSQQSHGHPPPRSSVQGTSSQLSAGQDQQPSDWSAGAEDQRGGETDGNQVELYNFCQILIFFNNIMTVVLLKLSASPMREGVKQLAELWQLYLFLESSLSSSAWSGRMSGWTWAAWTPWTPWPSWRRPTSPW